jgi:predicted SAM-dependent methyltransferase
MHRLLKNGGKVYILVPTADTRILKVSDKIIKLFEHEHITVYSTREFQNMFTTAGLTYKDCKVINGHQKIHISEKLL